MKPRTTIALLLVLLLLCLAYYGMVRYRDEAKKQVIASQRVFAFEPDDLRQVSVQQEDKRPTVGVRDDDGEWAITEPYPLRAYAALWDRLSEHLTGLLAQRIVLDDPSDEDLEERGLHEPTLTVQCETREDETHTVIFGKAGPTQTNRYARIDDGPVILADETAFFELNRDLTLLRYHYMVDPGDAGIQGVEFAWIWQGLQEDEPDPGLEPGEESLVVTVEHQGDGDWRMTSPAQGPADMRMLAQLITLLQSERCQGFIDEPEALSDYGLDPPSARLTVKTGPDAPPQTLYFGSVDRDGEQARLFAKRADAPAVFTVGADIQTLFPKTPDAYRDRRYITQSVAGLRELIYERDGVAVHLERRDDDMWYITQPIQEKADPVATPTFLNGFTRREAMRFAAAPDDGSYGLNPPRVRITLKTGDDQAPSVFALGAPTPEGDGCYGLQDTGEIVVVGQNDADILLNMGLTDFRQRRLVAFLPDAAVRIDLTIDDIAYVFEKPTQSWRIRTPEDKVWDRQSDMRALIDAISAIEAGKVEAEQRPADLAPYGLDDPTVVLTVTVQEEDADAPVALPTLRVGAVAPDNSRERFVIVDNRAEVFRMGQAAIDDIRQALRGIRDR